MCKVPWMERLLHPQWPCRAAHALCWHGRGNEHDALQRLWGRVEPAEHVRTHPGVRREGPEQSARVEPRADGVLCERELARAPQRVERQGHHAGPERVPGV